MLAAGMRESVPANATLGLKVTHAVDGMLPLGATAELEFRSPARGRLLGRCALTAEQLDALRTVYTGGATRIRLTTAADVVDASGVSVCRGSFAWSIKRER